jgi:ATP-dependent DNA helicase RecG
VHLLTGSTPAKARREILADIKSGEADIVIGTHALFSTAGEFRDLGLIVIDEQHRFGVEQRDKLRSQNDGEVPHMLIMTATPIPRSLAMVIFADLEISRLEEKPAQRGEIKTFSIEYSNKIWTKRMWERVREEIDKGRNVFVVAPRIGDEDPKELAPLPVDEPEELTAEDVSEEDFIDQGANSDTEVIAESAPQKIGSSTHTDIASSLFAQLTRHINLAEPLDSTSESVLHLMEALPKITALKGVDIGLLHGRMKDADKNRLMKEFLERKIQLLVSTTVIEVGIDVPNATVMVITDADKYGLATLHQLRGRIGRSELPSVCFLVTSKETAKHKITPQGKARVKTIVESGDGFDIANADIDIRGEGDIIGATQAGINSSLKLLRVRDDAEIIELANTLAGATLESDAYLDKNIGLKFAVLEELGEDEKEFLSKS